MLLGYNIMYAFISELSADAISVLLLLPFVSSVHILLTEFLQHTHNKNPDPDLPGQDTVLQCSARKKPVLFLKKANSETLLYHVKFWGIFAEILVMINFIFFVMATMEFVAIFSWNSEERPLHELWVFMMH